MKSPCREILRRFLAESADINFGGKVHLSAFTKWIDQVGYTCAGVWSGRYCVSRDEADRGWQPGSVYLALIRKWQTAGVRELPRGHLVTLPQ